MRPRPAGARGLHRVPGAHRRRLRRGRPVRSRRPDRRREVERHRRHDLRPLRHGPPLRRRPAGRGRGLAGTHRGPGAARLRPSAASAGPRCGSCASADGKATTKEARLERDGEVVAGNGQGARRRVAALLGLSAEQFTTCVVLPQGQFARFLQAKPAERQDLLVRLLELGLYDAVREAAGPAWPEAWRASWPPLRAHLDALAAATPEARGRGEGRVATARGRVVRAWRSACPSWPRPSGDATTSALEWRGRRQLDPGASLGGRAASVRCRRPGRSGRRRPAASLDAAEQDGAAAAVAARRRPRRATGRRGSRTARGLAARPTRNSRPSSTRARKAAADLDTARQRARPRR